MDDFIFNFHNSFIAKFGNLWIDCHLSYIINLLKSDSFPSPTGHHKLSRKPKKHGSAKGLLVSSIKTCPNFERTPKLVAYYGMLKPLPIISGKSPGKALP
jgi:hypothetical protein